MISDALKNIIFNKLYKDLGKAEIINYNGNIWFIDREKKYWYFELQKNGTLWWRYSFFYNFFSLFSFDSTRFEPILKDWVEEVLNCKVNTTHYEPLKLPLLVEEVLNCKVNTTNSVFNHAGFRVEEVLNCKVNTTVDTDVCIDLLVEEVLNCKVNTTQWEKQPMPWKVKEVLNCKVDTTVPTNSGEVSIVEEVLNCKVDTTQKGLFNFTTYVDKVLNHTVTNMDGGEMIDEESYVDKVLNHTIK